MEADDDAGFDGVTDTCGYQMALGEDRVMPRTQRTLYVGYAVSACMTVDTVADLLWPYLAEWLRAAAKEIDGGASENPAAAVRMGAVYERFYARDTGLGGMYPDLMLFSVPGEYDAAEGCYERCIGIGVVAGSVLDAGYRFGEVSGYFRHPELALPYIGVYQ